MGRREEVVLANVDVVSRLRRDHSSSLALMPFSGSRLPYLTRLGQSLLSCRGVSTEGWGRVHRPELERAVFATWDEPSLCPRKRENEIQSLTPYNTCSKPRSNTPPLALPVPRSKVLSAHTYANSLWGQAARVSGCV